MTKPERPFSDFSPRLFVVNNNILMKNLGILLSGRGSNFVAIADSIAAGRIPTPALRS